MTWLALWDKIEVCQALVMMVADVNGHAMLVSLFNLLDGRFSSLEAAELCHACCGIACVQIHVGIVVGLRAVSLVAWWCYLALIFLLHKPSPFSHVGDILVEAPKDCIFSISGFLFRIAIIFIQHRRGRTPIKAFPPPIAA
jgi:hypothetical protein